MTTTGTERAPRLEASVNTAPTNLLPRETRTVPQGGNASFIFKNDASLRELIAPDLFGQLAQRVTADGYSQETAERIVEQALAFLVACARFPHKHLSPSETVDAGWHAFILHTAEYAEFCERLAGRYIHHRPNGPGEATKEQLAIGVTIAAMRDAGLHVDPDLWVPSSVCSQCYQGCADDPRGA